MDVAVDGSTRVASFYGFLAVYIGANGGFSNRVVGFDVFLAVYYQGGNGGFLKNLGDLDTFQVRAVLYVDGSFCSLCGESKADSSIC